VRDVGVAANRVRVIHYGIESGRFEAPAAGSGASGRAVIGSVGRLEERKGHDCLIRAMPAILREVPQAQLRIAGNDPWGYGGTLRALVDRLHLDEHVELVGFRDDVASFLRETDVFAFASQSEGFGQVVIEAMAAARPVVVSNISPLTEIVADGQTGVLVEPGSPARFALAITRLLTNPDDMRRLGRSGQAHVEREFSARVMAERTLSVYEEVTARAMSVRSH
jgi:glycosyltransferase involved in cell wall biosynthesis